MPRKPRILSVTIEHKLDESPDLSWLGEYSNTPGKNCIDRQANGDMCRNEYRYCNVTLSAEDTGNPDSVQQDYERLEAFNRGDWYMLGIIAKASVQLAGSDTIQVIRSGGLWGIESDGDTEDIEADELANLKDELLSIGCTERQITHAFKSVGHKH